MSRRSKKRPRAPQAVAKPARSSAWRWHLAVLLGVTIAVYANSLGNGFVWDDDHQVLSNQLITDPRNIPQILTSNVWSFLQVEKSNYYRPLFMLLYMAEYFAFGYDPFFWHLTNLGFHVAALGVAYLLVRALGGEALAFLAALLFTLHPVHVEAVVWVAALPELVCGLAIFAGVLAYHRARDRSATAGRSLSLAALAFFCGLLAKETAIVLPGLFVAHDFLYRRESLREIGRGWTRHLPFAGVLAAYMALRLNALGAFAPATGTHFQLSAWEMALNVPVLVAQYVGKVLVPVDLNFYYVFEPLRAFGWRTAGAVLLIAMLVAALLRLRTRATEAVSASGDRRAGTANAPLAAFSIAWFFLTLAPVLSINNVGENVFTERYLYIPSLGFCIIVAQGALWLRARAASPLARHALTAAGVAICLVGGAIIVRRNPDLKDDMRLLSRTAEQSPRSPSILTSLGYYYFAAGRIDQAINLYQRSLALDPGRPVTHNNLGNALSKAGRQGEAIAHLRRAVELKPAYDVAWVNLGLAYEANGDREHAIACYEKAVELKPRNHEAWTALGLARWSRHESDAAITAYRRALEVKPEFLQARIDLAGALSGTGHEDEAIEQLIQALRIAPRSPYAPVIHFNLGVSYEHKQQWQAALAEYERALAGDPAFEQARRKVESLRARIAGDSQSPPLPASPAFSRP